MTPNELSDAVVQALSRYFETELAERKAAQQKRDAAPSAEPECSDAFWIRLRSESQGCIEQRHRVVDVAVPGQAHHHQLARGVGVGQGEDDVLEGDHGGADHHAAVIERIKGG